MLRIELTSKVITSDNISHDLAINLLSIGGLHKAPLKFTEDQYTIVDHYIGVNSDTGARMIPYVEGKQGYNKTHYGVKIFSSDFDTIVRVSPSGKLDALYVSEEFPDKGTVTSQHNCNQLDYVNTMIEHGFFQVINDE